MKRNIPSADDTTSRTPTASPRPSDPCPPLDRPRRRRLLQAITAAGVTSAALPDRWNRPVVDSVLLPAHAQATPVDVCALTCTQAQQETWQLVRNILGSAIQGFTSATLIQCESSNGMLFSSFTTFQSSVGVLTGTLSTATTLASLAGTDIGDTFVSFENSTLFQSAC